jgi:hypothetical protein
MAAAVAFPNIVWPDEIFQTLEQAHRAAFGDGIVPWEFRVGARSWVLPGVLAGLMKAAAPLGGLAHLRAAQCGLAALSIVPVVAAASWGRRSAVGGGGGFVAAAVVASWFELLFFASKALNEVVAAHLLVAAVFVAGDREQLSRLRLAGALLALSAWTRIHVAPAALVLAVYAARRAPRRWVALASGALPIILAAGLLDALTWSAPFQSVWENVKFNVLEGQSLRFGVVPWYGYLEWLGGHWSWAVLPMVAFAALGSRVRPDLAVAAIVVLVTHSAFGHKEYRFVYPAILLVVVLAGVGTASAVSRVIATRPAAGRAVVAALVSVWVALSAWRAAEFRSDGSFGFTRPGASMWTQGRGGLESMEMLGSDPSVCGVGLVNVHWGWTGGYTWMHRDVPIVLVLDPPSLRRYGAAFDALIVDPPNASAFGGGFRIERCWEDVCVLRRSGGCAALPGAHINAQLADWGA